MALLRLFSHDGAAKAAFSVFDVSGSTGTYPIAINDDGVVTGDYACGNQCGRAFVRAMDGSIATFSVANDVYGTRPYAINKDGTVAGVYGDVGPVYHGFLRAPDGTLTTFDPDENPDVWVSVCCVSNRGTTAGGLQGDGSFFRAPDGTITPVEITARGCWPTSTGVAGLNDQGTMTGVVTCKVRQEFSAAGCCKRYHEFGFIYEANGTITKFGPPEGVAALWPCCINDAGWIAGQCGQPNDVKTYRGFVRAPDGTITVFDAAGGAGYTEPRAMNSKGVITGWIDNGGHQSGFIRKTNGKIVTFDLQGAVQTSAWGINNHGDVTGTYVDAAGVRHGFFGNP
jgi:uncharacterized membrane protein